MPRKHYAPNPIVEVLSSLCTKCKCVKSSSEFGISPKKINYLSSWCNVCRSKYNKRYRRTSKQTVFTFLRNALHGRKRDTIKSGKELTITIDDLVKLYGKQAGLCALSGKELTWITGKGHVPTNMSIDRINNNKGYTPDNIQLVCNVVNFMKYTGTTEELLSWCTSVLQHNKNKE